MSILDQLQLDITTSLKSRDKLTADTLRGLKTRLQNESIAKMKELSPEEAMLIVRSEVKRRKEAVEEFAKAGRNELSEKENSEISILTRYLPPQATDEDVDKAIDEVLSTGEFTIKDFGKVMSQLKDKLGGTADMAAVSIKLKSKLT